jgi:cell division protein FtsQ
LKVNWIYIKGILLFALTIFLFGFSNSRNSARKIADISIEFEEENNLFLNYEMVNKLLIQNGESPKNKAKSVIDLHKLEENVLSHPMVENASVFVTVDGLLKAKVKQRKPVARVQTTSKSYYIDRQAKIMPLSDIHAARVLLFSGTVSEKDSDKIYVLATTILNDEFLTKQIIGVEKMTNGEFELETRIGNQKIILGDLNNLNQKFRNLKSFYTKTMQDSTLENYSAINLKYHNQVVCTKK